MFVAGGPSPTDTPIKPHLETGVKCCVIDVFQPRVTGHVAMTCSPGRLAMPRRPLDQVARGMPLSEKGTACIPGVQPGAMAVPPGAKDPLFRVHRGYESSSDFFPRAIMLPLRGRLYSVLFRVPLRGLTETPPMWYTSPIMRESFFRDLPPLTQEEAAKPMSLEERTYILNQRMVEIRFCRLADAVHAQDLLDGVDPGDGGALNVFQVVRAARL